jgi:4-amino-4-deoxy-L-arabinose transferase-like glycosyltransferase
VTLANAISGARGYGLLVLLCLALYLPGLAALPPTDRDEARFAQATRQMLESGDFLRIRFQDEARNKKPAGIYWLQAASVAALSGAESTAIWPYRLPSVAGALLGVLVLFHFGIAWFGREAAFLGAALLAASLGLTIEAHLAKTDAVLLATVVVAQTAFGEIYRRARAGEPVGNALPLLFWIAQGIGILVKGPITPLASLLTALALGAADRQAPWLRFLRPWWGLPLAVLIAAPWFIAIILATDGAFVSEAVGHDLVGKLIHGQESHGAPPGAYLLLAFVTFWPGSIALGAALRLAWRERGETMIRFLIAWIVPLWLVLELVPTKLPHYILPVYPALALLCARALMDMAATAARRHWLDLLAAALWGLALLGFAGVLIAAPLGLANSLSTIAVISAVAALGLCASYLFRSRAPNRIFACILAAVILWGTAFGTILPSLDALWLSRGAEDLIARLGITGRPVIAAGYAEPSLVFFLGTQTKLATPDAAASALSGTPSSLALVGDREAAAFRAALAKSGTVAAALGQVEGLNYSNGRRMTLTLYGVAPK